MISPKKSDNKKIFVFAKPNFEYSILSILLLISMVTRHFHPLPYLDHQGLPGINTQTAQKISTAEKSRRQVRFGRKFDGIDRSANNFHLKKFSAPLGFKKHGFENVSRELLFEDLSLLIIQ